MLRLVTPVFFVSAVMASSFHLETRRKNISFRIANFDAGQRGMPSPQYDAANYISGMNVIR
jgi:hypothetical protein